jgi:hypothetical protein
MAHDLVRRPASLRGTPLHRLGRHTRERPLQQGGTLFVSLNQIRALGGSQRHGSPVAARLSRGKSSKKGRALSGPLGWRVGCPRSSSSARRSNRPRASFRRRAAGAMRGTPHFANEIKRAPGLRKARGPAPRCHGEEDRQSAGSSLRLTITNIEGRLGEDNEGGPSFFRRTYQRVPSSERTVRAPRTSAACRVPAGRYRRSPGPRS